MLQNNAGITAHDSLTCAVWLRAAILMTCDLSKAELCVLLCEL